MSISSKPARLAAAAGALAAAVALAQPQPHSDHGARASTAAKAAATTPAQHPAPETSARATVAKSAFDGYRRYDDAPLVPWRLANDTVGRIGGWQAYAREAQEGTQR